MPSQPLDTTLLVVTPENIAFEYQLAGPFRRLPALIIDLMVLGALQAVLTLATALAIGWFSGGAAAFLILVMSFSLQWGYGIVLETFFNGQTLGKYLTGLRVLSLDGRPIDGMQATIRNVLRAADLWLPLAGLVTMAATARFQRLGDLVAGTMVVVEDRQPLRGVATLEDPRVAQLAACLPPSFVVGRKFAQALADYVDRRCHVSPARRREIARHVAQPLVERFGLPRDTSYDLLLCALYYRTFVGERAVDGAADAPSTIPEERAAGRHAQAAVPAA
jgi:uncharacterized RDD family membrane protein YckC